MAIIVCVCVCALQILDLINQHFLELKKEKIIEFRLNIFLEDELNMDFSSMFILIYLVLQVSQCEASARHHRCTFREVMEFR